MTQITNALTHSKPANPGGSLGLLQHQCACGQHTVAGDECDECRKKRLSLGHKAVNQTEPQSAPPVVHQALRSMGKPLDLATGGFVEPRFGHDFSKINLHPATPQVEEPRVKINQPGDKYEQEANRLADRVMRTPDPAKNGQRKSGKHEKEDEELQEQIPLISNVSSTIQRQISETYKEEEIKRRLESFGVFPTIASQIASYVHSLQGSGQPIPQNIRAFFEPRFGADLGQVRLHTDSTAALLAGLLNAKAFTVGRDILFGEGAYSPDTPAGRSLLAHELVHTIQQQGGRSRPSAVKSPSPAEEKGRDVASASVPGCVTEAIQGGQGAGTGQEPGKDAGKPSPANAAPAPLTTPGAPEAAAEGVETKEKAPPKPEEDPAYRAVVGRFKEKSKLEKTPPSPQGGQVVPATEGQIKKIAKETSHVKREDTREAAQLPPGDYKDQTNKDTHLKQVAQNVQAQPAFTNAGFMDLFNKKIEELAQKLPKDKEEHRTVGQMFEMGEGADKASDELKKQNQTLSGPMRELEKVPSVVLDSKGPAEIKGDHPGSIPQVKDARSAAPKPKTDEEISLDDKSRDLDDALKNHNVNGQTINIDEDSLAYPVSGEKSFDEAGEDKRKAQDEIAKSGPAYREAESQILSKAQGNIHTMVNGSLGKQHGLRSGSFNEVKKAQVNHKSTIEGEKGRIYSEFQTLYENTKTEVNKKLEPLNNIQETFETVISDAQKKFDEYVETQLEYIYTPGMFDYSDWIDEPRVQEMIKREYENLVNQGKDRMYAGIEARKKAQDFSADETFKDAKNSFIFQVKYDVEHKIAPIVVEALNTAKQEIEKGKQCAEEKFNSLSKTEQEEAQKVFDAVNTQFQTLEESVTERQGEIVNDMARVYNNSVGKLQAKFDTIKKDVLTSWWEKAWNKIKAVVNAIIDFVTKIGALLARLASSVGDIIASPRAFFSNLVDGIGQGFSTFVDKIDVFLSTAFFDWLRGSSGLPIELPRDFGPTGLFSLFTQLLGLSTETIWERMEVVYSPKIANAFRRGEVLLEKGLEVFAIIKNEGLGGLWDHIRESLGNILDETLDTIKETVLYAAIKKVMIEIGKMLIPGGGFIAIAEKIIRIVQFIVEARDKILELFGAFVNAVEMAVKGNIPGIVDRVTGALTKMITLAIDFLVTLFGLGSLKDKVTRLIDRIRKPVIAGIDFVLNKLKSLVFRVIGRGGKEPALIAEESPERKHLEAEETKETARPEKQDKSMPDIAVARQTVRLALDEHLPNGARQVADVEKVLAGVAPKVKPALADLRAEEFNPGKPKAEGAIGFKVKAKLQFGKDSIIDSVRFSQKGEALNHEQRWELGVKGVKRAVAQLEKRSISEETIKAQFPRWQTEFGFTALVLNTEQTLWAIEGEMSKRREVTTVTPLVKAGDIDKDETIVHSKPAGKRSKKVRADPLTKRAKEKGSPTTYSDVMGWKDKVTHLNVPPNQTQWVKAHLLHSELGGPDKWWNLVPARSLANNPNMYKIEKHVIDLLYDKTKKLRSFWYQTEVNYHGQPHDDFADEITITYGYEDAESNKKLKYSPPSVTSDPPKEDDNSININILGRDRLMHLLQIDRSGADAIVRARQLGDFKKWTDFSHRAGSEGLFTSDGEEEYIHELYRNGVFNFG